MRPSLWADRPTYAYSIADAVSDATVRARRNLRRYRVRLHHRLNGGDTLWVIELSPRQ